MINTVAQIGAPWCAMNAKAMRTSTLSSLVEQTQISSTRIRVLWPKYGCTILTDGWVDVCKRGLINILVSSCYGTIFMRSIDASASGLVIDGAWLFGHIKAMIDEIGKDNVIQVITDNASNCVRMGQMIEEEYPSIMWTPCASHSIDLLLEDVGKLDWVSEKIQKANQIARFFHRNKKALSIFRGINPTGLSILRPSSTRFGVIYIVIERLVKVWETIMQTVVSNEWRLWSGSKKPEAQQVQLYVLDHALLVGFRSIVEIMRPLYSLLRLTDREGSTLGLVYEFTRRVREELERGHPDEVIHERIMEVKAIVEKRWNWFKRPIHSVAHLLHPLWRGPSSDEPNDELTDGWLSYIGQVYDTNIANKLYDQLLAFRNRIGFFSHAMAQSHDASLRPVTWWEKFGGRTPELQKLALRILSQDCSSGACERNWSAHALVHTKRRNRLSTSQIERLIYCRENMRIMHKFENLTGPMQVNPDEVDVLKTPDLPAMDHTTYDLYRMLFEECTQTRRSTRSIARSRLRSIATTSREVASRRIAGATSRGRGRPKYYNRRGRGARGRGRIGGASITEEIEDDQAIVADQEENELEEENLRHDSSSCSDSHSGGFHFAETEDSESSMSSSSEES